jgi:uncharacterized SAM-binding protein YcdF (DUF218 family)
MRALHLPLPPTRLALPRRWLVWLLAGMAPGLAWAVGFGWFVHAAFENRPTPPPADGIVALTGGADRVETALHLLADGRARLLLVSGVGGAAEFSELAHRAGVAAALAPRVTLGRAAASTHGNAAETAEWARTHALRSLIVVTAGYHMPRALTEIGRALPGVALYPVAVQPPAMRGEADAATVRLLAGEYTKWLATEAGLSAIVSRTEERAQAAEHKGG